MNTANAILRDTLTPEEAAQCARNHNELVSYMVNSGVSVYVFSDNSTVRCTEYSVVAGW